MNEAEAGTNTGRAFAGATFVGLLSAALTLTAMPSIVRAPTTTVWGSHDSATLTTVWSLWHTAHQLSAGALSTHTTEVAYPHGGAVWPSNPIESVLIAPVTLQFGAVIASTVLALMHQALLAAFTWLLARRLSGPGFGPVVAAVAVSFSGVVLCTHANGELGAGQFYWVPLGALLALRAAEGRSSWPAGIVIAMALVGNVYIGISTLAAVTVLLWTRRKALGIAIGIAAVLAGPVLALAASVTGGTDSLVDPPAISRASLTGQAVGASVAEFFAPGARVAQTSDPWMPEYLLSWAPGWTLLIVVGFGISGGLATRPLVALCLVGLGLSLGPTLRLTDAGGPEGTGIPLPYAIVGLLPGGDAVREPWRFVMLLQLGLALLAARIVNRWTWSQGLGISFLLFLEGSVLNPGAKARRVEVLPDATAFAELPQGPVLTLPVRQGAWPLYFQTLHGQPIAGAPDRDGPRSLLGILDDGTWSLPALVVEAKRLGFTTLALDDRPGMDELQPVKVIAGALAASEVPVVSATPFTFVSLDTDAVWPDPHLESGRTRQYALPFRDGGDPPAADDTAPKQVTQEKRAEPKADEPAADDAADDAQDDDAPEAEGEPEAPTQVEGEDAADPAAPPKKAVGANRPRPRAAPALPDGER